MNHRPEYIGGTEAPKTGPAIIDISPESKAQSSSAREITDAGVKAVLRTHQEVNSPNTPESSQDDDRPMTEEEAKAFSEMYFQDKMRRGREQAELQAKSIYWINYGFVKYIREKHNGDGDSVKKNEFLLWENDYADCWRMLNDGMRDAHILHDMKQAAAAQEEMFFTKDEKILHLTVEAQAGRFYHERAKALRDAIEASDNSDEEKQRQLGLFSEFYRRVNRHLELKAIPKEEITNEFVSFNEYDQIRTLTHNNTIRSLNALNDLARKYKLRPFTPRNFWTSDEQDQTDAMKKRMRYDRDVVEEFYSIAFRDRVEAAEKSLERSIRESDMREAGPQYQAPPKVLAQPPEGYVLGPYGYQPPEAK